jgi:hypothetical protein
MPRRWKKRKPCCRGATTGWSCSNTRWEVLPLRNCWRSFCRPDVRCGFIVLAELADERSVADMIQAGAWDGAEKSLLNGADLLRTIWCALNLHAIEPKRNLAEDSVRKLSCAVPQSAGTIMIASSEASSNMSTPPLNR